MNEAFRRRCMSCNKRKNKYELIRVVRTIEKNVLVDKTGKMDGRGAYICNDMECLEKAIKTDRIFKILKVNANKKIYEDIRGVILDGQIK